MRLSRVIAKQRVAEAVEETLDELWPDLLERGGKDLVDDLADAVYMLLSELDTEEDLPDDMECQDF